MDFTTIKGHVQSWLLDLPGDATTRIPDWVNEAIKDAAKRYNFKFMQATQLATTVYPPTTLVLVAKPSNWKEARDLPYIRNQDGSVSEISWGAESDMVRTYGIQYPQETSAAPPDIGRPRYLTEDGTNISVWPLPDNRSLWANGLYRITVPYWAYPTALSADADTNFITSEGDWYVIWKACAIGFLWNRDEERAAVFEGKAESYYKRLERKDKLARLPDRITLATRRDVYAGVSRSSNRE